MRTNCCRRIAKVFALTASAYPAILRAGDWPQAITLWENLAARGCTDSLERLAKYHEHISRDLAAAQHYGALLPGDAAHEHRRRRVDNKIAAGQNAALS